VSDKKITELNNITSANLSDVDEFVVVDISGDETKAITYGELKQFNGAISSDTLDLNAIAATKAVTAVDVFVYDTSKDSDGGAWRKRTQGTSWYNETLNTATRGSRKEFPAVAVIVAEATKVTIYDGDDPSLPMWLVANRFSGSGYSWIGFNITSTATAVSMLNGVLCVGSTDSVSNFRPGLAVIDFGADSAVLILEPADPKDLKTISERNVGANLAKSGDVRRLVNAYVNDVAMTVLPDAPIDPATGLPVPTIAVATDGGVSVITDSGAVYDSSVINQWLSVQFSDDLLFASAKNNVRALYAYKVSDLIADGFTQSATVYNTKQGVGGYPRALNATDFFPKSPVPIANRDLAIAGDIGLSQVTFPVLTGNSASPTGASAIGSLLAYTTSTYNTGWMNGDIKGAFLSDTDDTDLVGGTDNDRSVKVNPLTVNGTVTRTAVATGADLVAYSGFSASNYLEQPYNSDLDFGTSDFCVMGWANFGAIAGASTAERVMFARGGVNKFYFAKLSGTDGLYFAQTGRGSWVGNVAVSPNVWTHVALVRRGDLFTIAVNGIESESQSLISIDLSLADGETRIGLRSDDLSPFSTSGSGLALWRISATAPTAEQIAKIYNDEKVLFQEGAQATLYGTSDAVTALAHDDATDLLHVGTSAGRSVFQGLRRVSNTTTAVGTAISASNGLVVEE